MGRNRPNLRGRDPGRAKRYGSTWRLDPDRAGRHIGCGQAMSTHSVKEAISKRRQIVSGVGRSRV